MTRITQQWGGTNSPPTISKTIQGHFKSVPFTDSVGTYLVVSGKNLTCAWLRERKTNDGD